MLGGRTQTLGIVSEKNVGVDNVKRAFTAVNDINGNKIARGVSVVVDVGDDGGNRACGGIFRTSVARTANFYIVLVFKFNNYFFDNCGKNAVNRIVPTLEFKSFGCFGNNSCLYLVKAFRTFKSVHACVESCDAVVVVDGFFVVRYCVCNTLCDLKSSYSIGYVNCDIFTCRNDVVVGSFCVLGRCCPGSCSVCGNCRAVVLNESESTCYNRNRTCADVGNCYTFTENDRKVAVNSFGCTCV